MPCLVLDVDRHEARQLLLTLDTLTGMAQVDIPRLDELLKGVTFESPDITGMLAQLAINVGVTPPNFVPATLDAQGKLDVKARHRCPECGHEW